MYYGAHYQFLIDDSAMVILSQERALNNLIRKCPLEENPVEDEIGHFADAKDTDSNKSKSAGAWWFLGGFKSTVIAWTICILRVIW